MGDESALVPERWLGADHRALQARTEPTSPMRTLLDDLRLAGRAIARRPGLSLAVSLTLGLGMGLTTMMFSVVNRALWRGFPIERPDRVAYFERTFAGRPQTDPALPPRDFLTFQGRQSSCERVAAFVISPVNVSGATGRPARYSAARVTANLFDLLGVGPVLGRGFVSADDRPGAAPVAVISRELWRDHFAGDPNLAGLMLWIDGESVPVVGVMPERFRFPYNEDLWLALRLDPASPRGAALQVVGRLKDGVALAGAQAEASAVAAALAREDPATNEGVGLAARPLVRALLGEDVASLFETFLASAVVVLLIACLNVANLLLAATSLRMREMAVRAALGGTRASLLRQLLTEVLLLAGLGGIVGLLLARIGIRLFNEAIVDTRPPFWLDIRLDAAAVAVVVGLIVVVGLAAGMLPAWRASGGQATDILRDESRGASGVRVGRLSRALVTIEIALCASLLVGMGLFVRSLLNVRATDLGFEINRVLTGSLALPAAEYPDATRQLQFWEQLGSRLGQAPGIQEFTLTSRLPGLGSGRVTVAIDGERYASERDYPRARFVTIAPRFFETFAVDLLQGRGFDASDVGGRLPVVIVDEAFAARFLPWGSPLGRRLHLRPADADVTATVVGLAPHLRVSGAFDRDPETIYLPLAQWPVPIMSFAARTLGEPVDLATSVRSAVATLDPDLPVFDLRPMSAALRTTTWFHGTFATMFGAFGASALLLALVGLYSLMALSVNQRTREIGVRLALGAQPRQVLGLVARQALAQVVIGLVLGLLAAVFGARLLSAFLVGVKPDDPGIFAVIAVVLSATAAAAVAGPCLRAARTNPADALRVE